MLLGLNNWKNGTAADFSEETVNGAVWWGGGGGVFA